MENEKNIEKKVDIFYCDIELVRKIIDTIEKNSDYVAPITQKECEPHYFFPLYLNSVKK